MNAEQISALSDDELYAKLQERGCIVGPVVASTRYVYERHLYKQLHGISACESSHESGDEEPDVRSEDNVTSYTVTSPSQSSYGSKVEFRHRPLKSYAESYEGIYFDRTSLARGSYRSDLQNTPTVTRFQGAANKGKYPTSSLQQPKKIPVALLAVVAFIVILAILVYFNMESSNKSPIPK